MYMIKYCTTYYKSKKQILNDKEIKDFMIYEMLQIIIQKIQGMRKLEHLLDVIDLVSFPGYQNRQKG